MYLEHFGLTEPPFKITPVTEFFFSGANRGEILDALVYAITDGEGIVKISGEVGSGKTMLCRMLLERLPSNIKAIYLANPSMSRDELLYAIADRLDLDLEGKRVNIILQTLQNHLEEMYERGERCVVLVDEAHAMPLETLEELRLLYNLQVGKHKLIQIVLFGQPELDEKLEQSNMRQLKDRIVHHFNILPISRQVINDYLMFRMRAAGYKGPDVFSPAAVQLIGKASQGLMRRVNILADKSLLAAFVENTHNIESRHVLAAIRDTEMTGKRSPFSRKSIAMVGGGLLFAATLAGAGWIMGGSGTLPVAPPVQPAVVAQVTAPVEIAPVPAPASQAVPSEPLAEPASPATPAVTSTAPVETPAPAVAAKPATKTPAVKPATPPAAPKAAQFPPLLQDRMDATAAMLAKPERGNVSIQLFYTDDIRPERMERFLGRAQRLGVVADIYIVPIKLGSKDGYRVLYGVYANDEAARAGIQNLPQRYKDAFAPTLYLLNGSQNQP
jgi:type II secretory pathway predicted ATPase ExeA